MRFFTILTAALMASATMTAQPTTDKAIDSSSMVKFEKTTTMSVAHPHKVLNNEAVRRGNAPGVLTPAQNPTRHSQKAKKGQATRPAAATTIAPVQNVKFEKILTKSEAVPTQAALPHAKSNAPAAKANGINESAPTYYTPGSLYVGMSNKYYGGIYQSLLAPSRGTTSFVPTAEFTNSKWEINQGTYDPETDSFNDIPYVAEADTLYYRNAPYASTLTFMSHTVTNADGDTTSYVNPSVTDIICGRNYNDWTGLETEEYGYFGVWPVSAGMPTSSNWYIYASEFGTDKEDTSANANGVAMKVVNSFADYLQDDSITIDINSVKIQAYTSEIPSNGAPYQLSYVYFLCRSVNTEDLPIEVKVSEIQKDGTLEVVGKGSAIIPANTSSEPFYDYLTIDLYGINALGETTDLPICTDKPLYLEVTGMDADYVDSFYMMVTRNEVVSVEEWRAETYWRKVYPGYGHMQLSFITTDGIEGAYQYPFTSGYYTDETRTQVSIANNWQMLYGITYPQIFDGITGEDHSVVTLPMEAEAAPELVTIDGDYNFAQLYEEGIITVEASDDWIGYAITSYEDYNPTYITIWAKSNCPSDSVGRTGTLQLSGYACDYTITVNQPAGAKGRITLSEAPTYYTPGSLYVGMSNKRYGGGYQSLLAPSRGNTVFVPTAKFTNSKWEINQGTYDPETDSINDIPYIAEADTLYYRNAPYASTLTFMSHTATNTEGETTLYVNPMVTDIICGRNYNAWTGLETEEYGYWGVWPVSAGVPTTTNKWIIWSDIFGSNKEDASANANGVAMSVVNDFAEYLQDDSITIDTNSIKIKAYTSEIPSNGAPYQLSYVYFYCRSVNTEDLPIEVKVSEIQKDGTLEVVGKGSAIIPANTTSVPFYDYLTVNLYGINELGLPTNLPICTNESLYLEVTGMDADYVESFYMMATGNEVVPIEEWSAKTYWRKVYPGYGHMQLSFTTTDGIEGAYQYPYTYGFYTDETNTQLSIANNWQMLYGITYPQIFDGITDEDYSVVNLPMEAEAEQVFIYGDYDFEQLLVDEIMTAQATEDWISFEIAYDEDTEATVVTVWANSNCPEDIEGRSGAIQLSGYACDYTIKVIQGKDVPGQGDNVLIKSIETSSAVGATEYYDLQGRKLSAAPAKGVYIQRNGTTATKLVK